MSDKPKCPSCGSECVIAISNQQHCNSCAADFNVEKDPVGNRARGEAEKRGYPKRA
jgi:hypothetical protein